MLAGAGHSHHLCRQALCLFLRIALLQVAIHLLFEQLLLVLYGAIGRNDADPVTGGLVAGFDHFLQSIVAAAVHPVVAGGIGAAQLHKIGLIVLRQAVPGVQNQHRRTGGGKIVVHTINDHTATGHGAIFLHIIQGVFQRQPSGDHHAILAQIIALAVHFLPAGEIAAFGIEVIAAALHICKTNSQLAKAIASKVDADAMDALQTAQLKYDGSASAISYSGIVDAVDIFEEEFNSEKVIFIHPKQVAALRKDADFIAADKIAEKLLMTGAIGKIANCEVVVSKKVPMNSGSTGYVCPIVKLNETGDTEDDTPAMTIYMKRNVNVETERHTLSRTTDISVDEIYSVALSNASKVVLATFKK